MKVILVGATGMVGSGSCASARATTASRACSRSAAALPAGRTRSCASWSASRPLTLQRFVNQQLTRTPVASFATIQDRA